MSRDRGGTKNEITTTIALEHLERCKKHLLSNPPSQDKAALIHLANVSQQSIIRCDILRI